MYNILFTRFISQIFLIIVNIKPFLRVEKIYNRFKDWYDERNSREHENNIQDSLNPFSKIELVKSKPTKAKRESCSNIFVSHSMQKIKNKILLFNFLSFLINIWVLCLHIFHDEPLFSIVVNTSLKCLNIFPPKVLESKNRSSSKSRLQKFLIVILYKTPCCL